MTPLILGFAVVCCILSFGLHGRRLWMWYAGWVLFYLFAAFFGNRFFIFLASAQTWWECATSLIWLAGGLLIWIPCILWWSHRRAYFSGGAKAKAPARPPH